MNLFNKFKLQYLHWVTCGWFISCFIITYLVSVLNGHVYAYFPYISDTGALPPESCIFGLFMNIGSVLLGFSAYIRYRQVELDINFKEISIRSKWNTVGIIFGWITCLGICIVGNFQETASPPMHFIGALLAFGIGTLYFFIQTRISYAYWKIRGENSKYKIGNKLFCLRVFLAIWLLPLFLANMVCAYLSMEQFTGESIVWWTEEDGGFQLRLAGSFTEWTLVIFVFIYIASFNAETKAVKFREIIFERI